MTTLDFFSQINAAKASFNEDVLHKNSSLRISSDFSSKRLALLREEVSKNPPDPSCSILTLAVAGSLARKEASELSDLDMLVTLNCDQSGNVLEDVGDLASWRKDLCNRMAIDEPNQTGVFWQPMSETNLLAISGDSSESYDFVAKRILFLLESTWLYNEESYEALLDKLITSYSGDVLVDSRKNFVFLLNDVTRYFRSLCVNYQFVKTGTDGAKWPLRNVKLRHSRVLMYFSMIASIGILSRYHKSDKVEVLKNLVRMPPLQRLFVCYQVSGDGGFFKVAGLYNSFLNLISQKPVRDELQGISYENRYTSNYFSMLKANSDALSSELLRFFEARRRQWDDRFFEYMIL